MRALVRAELVCPSLVLAVALALWLPRLAGPIDLRYDAGVYYILGTALAEGRGYRLLNEPGAIEAVQYPPLLPAMVAAVQWVLGAESPLVVGVALRRLYLLLWCGNALATYALARRYLSPVLAGLAAVMASLHMYAVFLSDLLFAELPYVGVTLLALLTFTRPSGRGRAMLLMALALAALYLRSVGAIVGLALAAAALAGGRRRLAAALAALVVTGVLGWQGYVGQVLGSEAYRHPAYAYQRASYQYYNVPYLENILLVDPFEPERGRVGPAELAARLATNVATIPTMLGESVSEPMLYWRGIFQVRAVTDRAPDLHAWLPDRLLVLPAASILIGGLVLVRRRQPALPLVVVFTILVLMVTPWPAQLARYMVPVNGLSLILALVGLQAAAAASRAISSWAGWLGRGGFALVVGGCLLVQGYAVVTAFRDTLAPARSVDPADRAATYRLLYYESSWSDFERSLDWLWQDARPDAIIATSAPHYVYLRTGLRAVLPPFEPDAERAAALLEGVPASYVVVDELAFLDVSRRYALPALADHPDRWQLAYESPSGQTRIYRLSPAAS